VVDRQPASLFVLGAIAGPLFTLSWLVQGLVRSDYDPMRHAVSSLSVGEWGWIQIATFVITGSFVVGFAVGLRRLLPSPSGSTWGPLLTGVMGIGLIGSGIFVTDPLNGYPPGTPILPSERTPHGILHDLFGVPFFLGVPIASLVFARFFSRHGQSAWAWYSRASGIAMFARILRRAPRIPVADVLSSPGCILRASSAHHDYHRAHLAHPARRSHDALQREPPSFVSFAAGSRHGGHRRYPLACSASTNQRLRPGTKVITRVAASSIPV
jgi:hypothetical protein